MSHPLLKLKISCNRREFKLADQIPLRVEITNEGSQDFELRSKYEKCSHVINGEEIWFHGGWPKDNRSIIKIPAGESLVYEDECNLDPKKLDLKDGSNSKITLELHLEYPWVASMVELKSNILELDINSGNYSILKTPDGKLSGYAISGGSLFHIGYSSEKMKELKIDFDSMQVLNPYYLKDKKRVYQNGSLLKKADAGSFKVLNSSFARDHKTIFTLYGDAKVEHPDSFEVLDDGNQLFHKEGEDEHYKAGYGRDRQFVYFYNGAMSTVHAIKVRSCRDPKSFVSLGLAYAKDKDNVYLEARRINGADPETWYRISRLYSKDKTRVFYLDKEVKGAHLETFEALPDRSGSAFDSTWAKDKDNHYHWEKLSVEDKYKAQIEKHE